MSPVDENNNVRGQTARCATVVNDQSTPCWKNQTKPRAVGTFVTNGARENAGQANVGKCLPER